MKKALFVLAILAGGCASNVPNTFVASEQQEHDAVAAFLQQYAKDHPEQAAAVNDNLNQWQAKLTAAKGGK